MNKKQHKKLTLAELVAKKKEREKMAIKIGVWYCKTEGTEFVFKKLTEDEFFYAIDKYPKAFEKESKMKDSLEFMDFLIYNCVILDKGKTLKDQEVRDILGVPKDSKNIIKDSAKALIDNFEDRSKFSEYILDFSGIGGGDSAVKKIKKK